MRLAGHVARTEKRRGACGSFVWKPERHRPLRKPGLHWRIILKWVLLRIPVTMVWTDLIWLTIGTGSGLLWILQWNCASHKVRRIFWLSENFFFQEGLCFMELLNDEDCNTDWNTGTYLRPFLLTPCSTDRCVPTEWHTGKHHFFIYTNLLSPRISNIRGAHNLLKIVFQTPEFHVVVSVGINV